MKKNQQPPLGAYDGLQATTQRQRGSGEFVQKPLETYCAAEESASLLGLRTRWVGENRQAMKTYSGLFSNGVVGDDVRLF